MPPQARPAKVTMPISDDLENEVLSIDSSELEDSFDDLKEDKLESSVEETSTPTEKDTDTEEEDSPTKVDEESPTDSDDETVPPKDEETILPLTTTEERSTGERSFEGIDEQDIPIFRQMSNEAYSRARDIYLERKQIQQKLETIEAQSSSLKSTFYDHPEGYALLPEFQQLMVQAQEQVALRDVYAQSLEYINSSNSFVQPVRDASGNIVPSAPMGIPEGKAEEYRYAILKEIGKIEANLNNAKLQEENIRKNHNVIVQQRSNSIKTFIDKYLKPIESKIDPNTLSSVDKVIKHYGFDNNPLTPILKNLYALIIHQENLLKNRSVEEVKNAEAKTQEPSAKNLKGSSVKSTKPGKQSVEYTTEEFSEGY